MVTQSLSGSRAAVTITAAVLALGLALWVEPMASADFAQPGGDHHRYIAMASGAQVEAPFAWRVAVPWVAGRLPFQLTTSFRMLAIAGVWAAGVAAYKIADLTARGLGYVGMLFFFGLTWGAQFQLYDPWLPDAVAGALIGWGVYAALTRRAWLLAGLLAAGVLVKESTLFVAPLLYSLNARRPIDPGQLGRAALVSLPALAILLAVRLAIPDQGYNYLQLARSIGLPRLAHPAGLPAAMLATFGLLPLGLAALSSPRQWLRWSPFLVLVAIQPLFAVNVERLLAVAWPAVIALALGALRSKLCLQLSPPSATA